jgi:hypothetical protein
MSPAGVHPSYASFAAIAGGKRAFHDRCGHRPLAWNLHYRRSDHAPTTTLPKSGRAPGNLRDAFFEAFDAERFNNDQALEQLEAQTVGPAGPLWNCTDTMPSGACADLDPPAGFNVRAGRAEGSPGPPRNPAARTGVQNGWATVRLPLVSSPLQLGPDLGDHVQQALVVPPLELNQKPHERSVRVVREPRNPVFRHAHLLDRTGG